MYSSRSIHFNTVIFFVSLLPLHTHFFYPYFCPFLPSVVPTKVALHFHSGCGQAYRQLCPELIAKLFCRSPIEMHFEWYDWQVLSWRASIISATGSAWPWNPTKFIPSSGQSVGNVRNSSMPKSLQVYSYYFWPPNPFIYKLWLPGNI